MTAWLLAIAIVIAMIRRVEVYTAFTAGAQEGMETAMRILPGLAAIFVALRMLEASGLMHALCCALAPVAAWLGLPEGVMPLLLLRPLSGSASLGMLADILRQYGPDSRTGLVASAMMGSGGMIVMDEDNCMVDIARFFLDFTVDESCGKCTPCRVGTRRMLEILERIVNGKGEEGDIERLEELANTIKSTALCGLGQTAPNPVLSTLKFFRSEYEAHIREKRCPAHHCRALLHYVINPDLCRGCTACTRVCPVEAISGELRKPHQIDTSKCLKCGACAEKCKFHAITRE